MRRSKEVYVGFPRFCSVMGNAISMVLKTREDRGRVYGPVFS